jgi:hypothetical protein
MPKVTITIEDKEPDDKGNVNVTIDFDPVISKDTVLTPAQGFALQMLEKNVGDGTEVDE